MRRRTKLRRELGLSSELGTQEPHSFLLFVHPSVHPSIHPSVRPSVLALSSELTCSPNPASQRKILAIPIPINLCVSSARGTKARRRCQ
ncbi:hypothetical protein SCHPADRAFT_906889 [Schizopora paradoxa]|uniref:Uncharacterized protein n=1 Tax=Schizopora paradoxa TaxID=27342 RepID=A0A0H2S0D4_9AGAM|nr:hypothetical protein SCHPADRAFT_906889 [Schizopora paradoxa]